MNSNGNTYRDIYKLNALILTNHMADIGGSEIVALEIGELLQKAGYRVSLHCNYLAEPMASLLFNSQIVASDSDNFPNVFEYDFVWSQHHVISLALAHNPQPDRWETRFVSAHLSPYEPFEAIGIVSGLYLGSRIVANSLETALRLSELAVDPEKVVLSYNACPESFWSDNVTPKNYLKRILLVSNHPPIEVLEALQFLQAAGIDVHHIGSTGEYRRVRPEDITNADAVITIGKTVQYAVMGATPIYCYDHFGGPGWLVAGNFEIAEKFNFSGRGCGEQKTPNQIATEILEGHALSAEFVYTKRVSRRELYSLDKLLNRLTTEKSMDVLQSEIQRKLFKDRLDMEAIFSAIVRRSFRSEHGISVALTEAKENAVKSTKALDEFKQVVSKQEDQIASLNQALAEYNEQIVSLNQTLAERDQSLAERDQSLAERDLSLAERDAWLAEKDMHINDLQAYIQNIQNGLAFRFLSKYRRLLVEYFLLAQDDVMFMI